MSFHFHPRKLLINESFQDSISEVCQPYCIDRTLNKDGSCPILCMSQCYQTCYHPLPLIPDLLLPSPPPPPPPPVSYRHLSRSFGLSVFLIVFLAVLATSFLFFFSYTVYKLFRQQRRRQPTPPQREVDDDGDDDGDEEMHLNFLDEDRGPVVDHPIWYIRTPGLQPSVISAITMCKYKKGDGLVEGTDCSVCLNEFQEDESLRLLPKCNHAFHIHCIDTWLRSHTNCPMCRASIVINSARLQSPSNTVEEETLVSVSGDLNIRVLPPSRDVENDEPQRQDTTIEVDDVNENRCSIIGSRDGIQPLRRSVSLDSLSASVMSSAITDAFAVNSGRRSVEYKQDLELEMNGTRSSNATTTMADTNNQSLSKSSAGGSSSMVVRSLSCSAKVFLSRYSSRSTRSSIVPLPRSF